MRLPRHLLALLVTAPLAVAATPAHAVSCNLLVDPVGDASPALLHVLGSSPDLDIVSGDVASTTSAVGGVLRLRDLQTSTLGTLGARWTLHFDINGTSYAFVAHRDVNGTYSASLSGGFVPIGLALQVNATTSSITWRVPRASVPDLPATTGTAVFEHISAVTAADLLVASTSVDAATTAATYVDGTPACFKV